MSIKRTQRFEATPTSPDLIKKVEKGIIREQKNEEANLKHIIKDLSNAEKAENKAHKSAVKAEHNLSKAEKAENSALKNLHKAQHTHDVSVSNVHSSQNTLESNTRNYQHLQQSLQVKKGQVDAAIKANDEHTAERNAKLTALRGPAEGEAARIVAQPTQRVSGSTDA